jgi:hypothetical protein
MYVEYVFVGHGLIDYCRPVATLYRAAWAERAAGQWCSHQRRWLVPALAAARALALGARSGSHMMMIIMSENGAFSIPSSNNCTRPAM